MSASPRLQPLARAELRERGSSPWLGRGSPPSPTFLRYQDLQRQLSTLGGVTPLAPATPVGAFMDWWLHLASSPAKQWELAEFALEQFARLGSALTRPPQARWCVDPLPQDKRFDDPQWRLPPFSWFAQAFLLRQEWWQRATTSVPGVSAHHEQMMSFGVRQWQDMVAPSNAPLINPVVLRRTVAEGGLNLLRGARHAADDAVREAGDLPPDGAEGYRVGENIAITPGRVVLRNRLIELIQYAPSTPTTHPQPVLLVPAWIMKYYILDLSPRNSLVRHLVDQGFTVFAISWKNPDAGDRDLGLDDYHELGVLAALDAIGTIVPGAATHALGYCLGGTLLAMSAAALGRSGSRALKSLTLLAAQTDFTDPGELSLFIDDSQVAHLEDRMWPRGFLDKRQMKATFQMMRSNDLVWSYRTLNYLLGQRQPMSDLMAWNADGTRLPLRMHSEYLHRLFLQNALARGEMKLGGSTINLRDIAVPLFLVGTIQDHIAPWRSVYKLNALTDVEQTLVLTAGGHNAGIVNPPSGMRSSYRIGHWRKGDRLQTPEEWMVNAPTIEGSWWTAWFEWLEAHSTRRTRPPAMGARAHGLPPLQAAPGTYVHQR
ncbi:MAG TPA: alpha/beta fold hydrolase [Albitalea sp.]|uniref:PHA/PHB synthase family protein n=1 Tax=Piscinibacter sp. TaxID=1903157 RepID=UPI002ED58540